MEGIIKFDCRLQKKQLLLPGDIEALQAIRQPLFERHLIGADEAGYGYGNISCRYRDTDKFIITASQTSGLQQADISHYVLVEDYKLEENILWCTGMKAASSESMTHAALYSCSPEVKAVIHIHHRQMWDKLLLEGWPATDKKAAYGSPEMIKEIIRLYKETQLPEKKLLAMAGHETGILAFGNSPAGALSVILSQL